MFFLEPFMINLKYPTLEPGLYVISLPIGCLSDLTFRALNVLKFTKNIFAEDTRNAKTLLLSLDIDISQKKNKFISRAHLKNGEKKGNTAYQKR